MTTYALLFEAKSIQEYLFESGRLRDVIGASELVDSMTGALLDEALAALGLEEDKDLEFSRRAGGAFYAFSDKADILDQLLALWTLLLQQYAPGLAYDLGRGQGEAPPVAFDAARAALRADASRQRPPLPVASPITERSQRTGLAAEARDQDGPVDAATRRKKKLADPSRAGFVGRFSPPEAGLGWHDWPRNLEPGEEGAFPFEGDDRTVAVTHADGNGLGQVLMKAREAAKERPEQFIGIFRTLSRAIAESTEKAAQEATRRVLLPARNAGGPLPARPILLGGDDMTILVRADLAVPYLRVFAEAFEAESRNAMQSLARLGVTGLPDRLTAGAGLVYLRASQPFYLATRLAESLMELAKRRAKAVSHECPPSAVAFHRVTSTLVDDYATIVEGERSHRDGDQVYTDTLGAYLYGTSRPKPRLADLLVLQQLLQGEGMARGPTRQLLTLMGLSPAQARMRYRRWRQLMGENRRAQLDAFDAILARLLDDYSPANDLPYGFVGGETRRRSPLGDALALMAVGNVLPGAGSEDDGGEDAA